MLGGLLLVLSALAFLFWPRGLELRDGRHDRGRNGIWIQHGWLGHRSWFEQHDKLHLLPGLRDPARVRGLARILRRHHVRDVFPHLCPASASGELPPVDHAATRRFLEAFGGLRVMPWVGGVLGRSARVHLPSWRHNFVASVQALLARHPRLAGVHVNIEPWPSGHRDTLLLLSALRAALPAGKQLSVAAYPPPTMFHPYEELHWDRDYYQLVARHVDQLAVMAYDTSLRFPMLYRRLMAAWTREVLQWAPRTSVLIGLPTYDDSGVGYHHPDVENLRHALPGVHQGLAAMGKLPDNYQGAALYCEWEMTADKWRQFREGFVK